MHRVLAPLLVIALAGCSSPSFDLGTVADANAEEVAAPTDTGGTVTSDVTEAEAEACVPSESMPVAFSIANTDVAAVSRASAISIGFGIPKTGRVHATTLTFARQQYRCPPDIGSMACRSLDPQCGTCTIDTEGSCTCTSNSSVEGTITAKLYSGTPGAGVLLATTSTATGSINTAPAVTSVRFDFSGAAIVAAGTEAYVELTTNASAAQFALRGGALAPPYLRMWLRQTFTGGPFIEYKGTAPRPATVVELTSCD